MKYLPLVHSNDDMFNTILEKKRKMPQAESIQLGHRLRANQ